MTILDKLAGYARERVAADKNIITLEEYKERCSSMKNPREPQLFKKALQKKGLSFICEVKKASPSKGIISEDFPYLDIATEYERAGADCVSCLTEPTSFLGSDRIFTDIRKTISTPMLRKDFTVDEYQIYQAKAMGADAILLICAILEARQIEKYLDLCDRLGLSALVETHDAHEIKMAVSAGAEIIGVNNRNLKDFTVDFSNAQKLRDIIPSDRLYVAESGVASAEDVVLIKRIGADAVLMGEVMMRAENKTAKLAEFREA